MKSETPPRKRISEIIQSLFIYLLVSLSATSLASGYPPPPGDYKPVYRPITIAPSTSQGPQAFRPILRPTAVGDQSEDSTNGVPGSRIETGQFRQGGLPVSP